MATKKFTQLASASSVNSADIIPIVVDVLTTVTSKYATFEVVKDYLTEELTSDLSFTKNAIGFSIAGGTSLVTLTVSGNATISGTNTGDVSLATNSGLVLSSQVINMGTPATITGSSTNTVSGSTHNHNLDLSSPSAIGETAPSTIRSFMNEVLVTVSTALTTLQTSGVIINNYGQDTDVVNDLPAAAKGLNFIAILGTTVAKYYRFRCLDAANDKIYLDGVAGSDDGYVGVASAAIGNAISFVTFQTGSGTYDWFATTLSGTWVAG